MYTRKSALWLIALLVVLALPAAGFSGETKDQKPATEKAAADKPATTTPAPTAPVPAAPLVQEDKPLPPDKYYELVLERQELEISSLTLLSKRLDEAKGDPKALKLIAKQHEEQRKQKVDELFKKYGVTPESYYRTYRGADIQKERGKYLDAHPEIRDKIAANSKTIKRLEPEVWSKLNPLLPKAQPAPKEKKPKPGQALPD